MLTSFDWFSMATILVLTFAGGFLPLFRPEQAKTVRGFPSGQAFAAGVFLALALTLMLPSAFHLFNAAFPHLDYPTASVIAILAFLFLLTIEHVTHHMHIARGIREGERSPPIIPVIMTAMIAIPSFFLGAALGVSPLPAAAFILIAIIAHKSSAGFALAIKMARSTMNRPQVFVLFTLFACATPLGILVGGEVHRILGTHTMTVVKAFILAMASGVFLYMSTLHELRNTPLIVDCCNCKGFLLMVCGFMITALVRWLIGEAHHIG
jgi:zinc transporter ZupT